MRIWTIGHSTRSADAFLALLAEHRIEVLADIRRFPTSRWEQFQQPNLRAHLSRAGIKYVHLAALGGFRGNYVAYTETPEFAAGLEELLALAANRSTAIMCAEAVFFRCHRRFVADVLVRRGVEVLHIMEPGRVRAHKALPTLEKAMSGAPSRPS